MDTKFTPDQLAAHELLSELRTRIAIQPLPYQYGIEARALESLWEIFGLARKAMKGNPGCENFAGMTTDVLNLTLRPVTAKWHRAHKAGLLESKDGANEFRSDLAKVREKLHAFACKLHVMAYGTEFKDGITPSVISDEEIAECMRPIQFGIQALENLDSSPVTQINAAEKGAIDSRRKIYRIDTAEGTDAIGLALSGGGIRSATFCLGVVQVLAERGLMKDVDYLSTVSGGGFTGTFLTGLVGQGGKFKDVGNPHGPDTKAIRHVRLNAKYLSAVDLKQRWLMAIKMMAGLFLNLSGPFALLVALAFLANFVDSYTQYEMLRRVAVWAAAFTVVFVFGYGLALRFQTGIKTLSWALAISAGVSLISLVLDFIERGHAYLASADAQTWGVTGVLAGVVIGFPAIALFLPIFRESRVRKLVIRGVLLAAACITPLLTLVAYYGLREIAISFDPTIWTQLNPSTLTIVAGAMAALFAFIGLNINLTGLHKIYRDMLARAFLPEASLNEQKISETNSTNRAPYHLINSIVNLPSSLNPALRDRRGDFFVFSRYWCGSQAVGYHQTQEWEAKDPHLNVATAMAISGAAASPHMGRGTLPTLSAVMTLLNLRLGYWAVHPNHKRSGVPGFLNIVREMTGLGMSERSAWLNLSDGGHIENMGIYELLRRRCKFVICIDGEADPQSTFEGKLTLVRHAQIDFGVRLEPKLDDVKLDAKSGFSRTHFQLFRIHYPPQKGASASIGLLLYFKLSLTGDETEFIRRYRAIHPDFPHESTINQFYDEEQFEAYRQLGVHVAEGAFSPALLTEDRNPATTRAWIGQLAKNMLEPSSI